MEFGEILTKAWKIIWKFKILWVFGILSSCGQGGGGGGGGGNSGVQFSGNKVDLPSGMSQFFYDLETFFNHIQGWQIAALIIGFFFFILILSAVFSAISTVGRIGLIQGTVKADAGADRLTFQELFNSGKPFFLRIFGLNLLIGLAIFIFAILMILPIVGVAIFTLGIGLVCLIPIICLLVPVSWLASVVIEQANIAIVVEDLNIIDGLQRGWEVFRDNIGNMILMALILVIGGGIVGIILAFPMFLVMVPILIGLIGGSTTGNDFLFGGGIAVAVICFIAYLPVIIVLGGILQAYLKSAWTLTYLRLTGSPTPEAELADELLEDNLGKEIS